MTESHVPSSSTGFPDAPVGQNPLRHRRLAEPPVRIVDNPILLAQARRRLRRRQTLPGVLIVALLGICGVLFASVGDQDDHKDAFRALCYTALGAIAVLYGIRGTMQTSTTIADERRTGILDFHRATPTSPLTDTLGYLLGTTAREALFAAVLVPFAVIGAVLGGISIANLVLALGVITLSSLLYQTTGLLSGLSIDNRRGVSGAAVAVTVLLQSFAMPLHLAGFVTVAYLTPFPALTRLLVDSHDKELIKLASSVSFYGVTLHPVLFTLLVQGSVLAFLVWAAARRIHREGAAPFSRLGAAGFFSLLAFLSFGGLWNLISSTEVKAEVHAAIGGAYVQAAIVVATALIFSLTPSYIEFLRALRRARRAGQPEADILADGGPAWPLVGLFGGLVVAGLCLLAFAMRAPGGLVQADTATCIAAIVAFLALVAGGSEYTKLAQRRSARNVGILIFFLTMVLPWLLFGIASAAKVGSETALFLGALSPSFAIGGSAIRLVAAWSGEPIRNLQPAHLFVSLAVTGGLACWFLLQTRSLQQTLAAKIPLGKGR